MPGHDPELAPRPGLTPAAESAMEKLARETTLGDAPASAGTVAWLVASLESRRDQHDGMAKGPDGSAHKGAAAAYRVALLLVSDLEPAFGVGS